MSNINREIETLRKDHKEILGIKKARTEMKNTLNELMNSLLIINAGERICDLEDISVELSKIE